ncbi:hypothetical protein [Microbacterium sp. 22242]|uniref:hypothetical protein n=1 Tax=Microbacterium sp. 22242 TaxID=3453896 RepID=UPI003F84A5FF
MSEASGPDPYRTLGASGHDIIDACVAAGGNFIDTADDHPYGAPVRAQRHRKIGGGR